MIARRLLVQVFAAAAASLIMSTSIIVPGSSAIETVDTLDVGKYLGRWYALYTNVITAVSTVGIDASCIIPEYALDEPTGNITLLYTSRASPTEPLSNTTGYIYAGTNTSEPGQLMQKLTGVASPSNYWIVGLGPEIFGVDGLYDWAIVSEPLAQILFILVRDVQDFEENYAEDVLSLVDELGFNDTNTEPLLVDQEDCLPF